jgi:hypothetical protein
MRSRLFAVIYRGSVLRSSGTPVGVPRGRGAARSRAQPSAIRYNSVPIYIGRCCALRHGAMTFGIGWLPPFLDGNAARSARDSSVPWADPRDFRKVVVTH